jgi:hypothetical protein
MNLLKKILNFLRNVFSKKKSLDVDPTSVKTKVIVGVGTHSLDSWSREKLSELKTVYVRHTLYWSQWQDERYRTEFETNVSAAISEGFKILIVVHWLPNELIATAKENKAEIYQKFSEFVTERVKQFPQIEAWQIWNEVDSGFVGSENVFGWSEEYTPIVRSKMYATQLRIAYSMTKSANPNTLVVSSGLATQETEFVDAIINSKDKICDVIALHCYGFQVVDKFNELSKLYGDRKIEFWCTEFGLEEAVVPVGWDHSREAIDDYHLHALRDTVKADEVTRFFTRMYFHVLRQGGDTSYDLIRVDDSLRPAAVWLQTYQNN